MLFAFVACNPNSSSSSSADDTLLPGEVTPPADSERKSMSDADINKVAGALMYYDRTECSSEDKREVDFGEDGTLSIKKTEYWKDGMKEGDRAATVTANGKITVGGDSYVVDNLELSGKTKRSTYYAPNYLYDIENGSIKKNGTAMGADQAYSFLLDRTDFYKDAKCKAYTEESSEQSKLKILDDNDTAIGSGTATEKCMKTMDEWNCVWVYDLTVNGSDIQVKISEKGEGNYSIDYAALDGSFFDKASCDKLMEMLMNG